MLTIAHITDLHITSDKDPLNRQRNEERLRKVLRAIHARKPRPVAIIASGNLVDRGEPEEYLELKRILQDVHIPLYLGVGSHDLRAPLRRMFPEIPVDPDGFVQYAADLGGLRLVMCDTLEEGKSEGAFCKKRAAWLKRALRADRRTPTIVAMHHAPIVSGIQWMDPQPDAEWIKRFAKTVEGRRQVKALVSGHVHRACHGVLAGQVVSVAPPTSMQYALDLTPMNMRVPDGREILVEEPPGYGLHVWEDGQLTSHICVAGDFPAVATYDEPFIRG